MLFFAAIWTHYVVPTRFLKANFASANWLYKNLLAASLALRCKKVRHDGFTLRQNRPAFIQNGSTGIGA